jgi:hypothetical protein
LRSPGALRMIKPVSGWVFVVTGALLTLVGAVWTLQGVGVLGGSVMSGVTFWAVVGPVVAIVGLLMLWRGVRLLRTR